MKELERFYKLYPPQFPARPTTRKEDDLDEPSGSSLVTARSRTPALSESTHNDLLNLPYLAFQHLEILHHKLKLIEDHGALNRLQTIVKK